MSMQGVTVDAPQGRAVVHSRPLPKLRDSYILVKTEAVALNPADAIYVDFGIAQPGTLLGCDFAGTVEEAGPAVRRFKKGDRVCGCARAGTSEQPEDGTFAEYIMVKGDVALHIPDGMSFEDAATLGVVITTTGRAFHQALEIPAPPSKAKSGTQVLVYGGSSAMGTMVIQFAKLVGLEVLTTCSSRNFELVKSYGGDKIVDYSDEGSIDELRATIKGDLKLAIDCISNEASADYCAKLLGPGALYSAIGPVSSPRNDVKSIMTIGYSFLGESWQIATWKEEAKMEDFHSAVAFAETAEKLLAEGKIRVHPVQLRDGGLSAIPQGVEDLRQKKVSGSKIVVSLA